MAGQLLTRISQFALLVLSCYFLQSLLAHALSRLSDFQNQNSQLNPRRLNQLAYATEPTFVYIKYTEQINVQVIYQVATNLLQISVKLKL